MLITNTQAMGTEYISELVDHGCRACNLSQDLPVTRSASAAPLVQTTTLEEGPDAEVGEPRVASGAFLTYTTTLPERQVNATKPENRQTAHLAEVFEGAHVRRWKGKHGRPGPKADTGNVEAINQEMMCAFRHSPDVIAKVGNFHKKRPKIASQVEMFPKLLEERQKQGDAMSARKRWDKSTDERRSHIKEMAKTKFGATENEWKQCCSKILKHVLSLAWGEEYGKTFQGQKFGVWNCGGCGGGWSHATDGPKRLLLNVYDENSASVAYCNVSLTIDIEGNMQRGWTPAFEIQIHILQGAQLLNKWQPFCFEGAHDRCP